MKVSGYAYDWFSYPPEWDEQGKRLELEAKQKRMENKLTTKMERFKKDLAEMRLGDFKVAFEIMQEEIKSRYLLKALETDPIEPKREDDVVAV